MDRGGFAHLGPQSRCPLVVQNRSREGPLAGESAAGLQAGFAAQLAINTGKPPAGK
jgi:hypothetical protein